MNAQQSVKQAFVLDASAIFNGILGHNLDGIKYIPECVLDEIRGMFRGEAIIEEALLYEDLKVISPDQKYFDKIQEMAQKTGDKQELSECDMTVLALGLYIYSYNKQVMIVSDDYDIQNLAKVLNLPCRGIHWKGITHTHSYQWICTGCGFKSKIKIDTCIECGSKVRRKTIRKRI